MQRTGDQLRQVADLCLFDIAESLRDRTRVAVLFDDLRPVAARFELFVKFTRLCADCRFVAARESEEKLAERDGLGLGKFVLVLFVIIL